MHASRSVSRPTLRSVARDVAASIAACAFMTAMSATAALAGEHLTFHFLGTSPDGRHAAFEQYGVMDGSGSAIASVHVFDTATNQAFRPAWRRVEPENSTVGVDVVRRQLRDRAAIELTALGIDPERVGRRLLWHPRTDLGVDDHRVHVATHPALGGMRWRELSIELAPEPLGRDCHFFGEALSVDLVLHTGDRPRVLVDDFAPPGVCALDYRIEEVRLIDETELIVVLNVLTPGFEGHSAAYAVVAGRLDAP